MRTIIIIFLIALSGYAAACQEKRDGTTSKRLGTSKEKLLDEQSTVKEDTIVGSIYLTTSCSKFLLNEVNEIHNIGIASRKIIELKNGVSYIEKQGFLDLATGKLFDLKDSSSAYQLFELLGDSIVCIRSNSEQQIFNLRSNYQYYRKSWVTKLFSQVGTIESFNGNVVPIFENDSTLLITQIVLGRVIKRIFGIGKFSVDYTLNRNHLFIADMASIYKINMINGEVDLSFPVGQIGSRIILANNMVICWDRAKGLVAFDVERGNKVWECPSSLPNKFTRILADDKFVYFSDQKIKAVNINDGKIIWTDNSGSYATRPDNFAITNDFLITNMYYDSDAVIVLIDKETGRLKCNGFEMPNSVGFGRYSYFETISENIIFAEDVGGNENKIVGLGLIQPSK